ncbi:putative endonuclease lcl3 [Leucoagaricus gongylophorus]
MFSSIWPSKPPNDRLQQASTMESPQHKSVQDAKEELEQQFIGLPVPLVALIFFGLGFACSTGGALLYARYGRRIRNTDWIVPDYFEKNRWIRGVVTSVGDADNFRFFHTPLLGGWHWPLKFRKVPTLNKELVNQTLHVRIAGVDAPEVPLFFFTLLLLFKEGRECVMCY